MLGWKGLAVGGSILLLAAALRPPNLRAAYPRKGPAAHVKRRTPLRSALLGLLVAAAALGFLGSLEDALAGYDLRLARAGPPLSWRFGKAPVVALERCVTAARPHLPPGTAVAFAGPAERRGDAFLRWRWAAYFLSEHDLVRWGRESAPGVAVTHVLACRRALGDDPRLAEVARLPGGRLYRVRAGRETL